MARSLIKIPQNLLFCTVLVPSGKAMYKRKSAKESLNNSRFIITHTDWLASVLICYRRQFLCPCLVNFARCLIIFLQTARKMSKHR